MWILVGCSDCEDNAFSDFWAEKQSEVSIPGIHSLVNNRMWRSDVTGYDQSRKRVLAWNPLVLRCCCQTMEKTSWAKTAHNGWNARACPFTAILTLTCTRTCIASGRVNIRRYVLWSQNLFNHCWYENSHFAIVSKYHVRKDQMPREFLGSAVSSISMWVLSFIKRDMLLFILFI